MRYRIGQYRTRLESIQMLTELETDMAGPARRDLVWDATLRALVSNPASIRLRDVQMQIDDDDVSDRTIRRAMNAMQSLGWLEKDKDGGHYWYPGPKARKFLRVPASRQVSFTPRSRGSPEGRDAIDVAASSVDVHADNEELEQRRRDLLRNILADIRDNGEVKVQDIKKKYYAEQPVGYGSENSWWKNFVYLALREIDIVETGGEGSHTWFYVGEE